MSVASGDSMGGAIGIRFHRLGLGGGGRFAGALGEAADLALEGLFDAIVELPLGLDDLAAEFRAAAGKLRGVEVLLHLAGEPAADGRFFGGSGQRRRLRWGRLPLGLGLRLGLGEPSLDGRIDRRFPGGPGGGTAGRLRRSGLRSAGRGAGTSGGETRRPAAARRDFPAGAGRAGPAAAEAASAPAAGRAT